MIQKKIAAKAEGRPRRGIVTVLSEADLVVLVCVLRTP